MSTEFTNVIQALSKFLEPKLVKKLEFSSRGETIKLESTDDIKNLPLETYNFIGEDEAKYLEEFLEISNIAEAAKFRNIKIREKFDEKIKALFKKYPKFEDKLEKAITISSIISSIKSDAISIDKENQKVIVVGLDNAGKTAILTKFGGKLGIMDLANLKPTKGVKRKVIESSNLDLFIWDMGGQKQYRSKYLKNPDQYFLQIDLLIYVIDVQDSERFESSFDYFETILDTLVKLDENPYILIFIHKYDPDLKRDPTILLNVEFLKDNLKELFNHREIKFDYEVYLTSIFSLISNEPQFSKYLKDIMKAPYGITDPTVKRVEGLGEILEETLNAVIRLSESISLQLSAIEHRLEAIEGGAVHSVGSIEAQGSQQIPPKADVRSRVLDELKDLFDKKKKLNI
ncbi:MAG: ADP-ribosylation factor-like protein [Candidatus Thorarchaeota archaeon]